MRVQLVGDNARYLARLWQQRGLVDGSENETAVEFYPKPNSPGADALYDSYLLRLQAEANGVGVGMKLEDDAQVQFYPVRKA